MSQGDWKTADRVRVEVEEDLSDLIPGYLESRARDVETVRAALAAGDLGTVRSRAHDVRGSGASYGFVDLSHIAAAMEDAAREGKADAIGPLIEDMASYLSKVDVVYVEED